jgi:toxin ParE1/3/4
MSGLVWTSPAVSDLDAIYEFIANDSEYYASSFVEELIQQSEKLMEFPKMGRIVPEYNRKDIRELFFQSYRIIYQISENRILILTVIHGKRDLLSTYAEI